MENTIKIIEATGRQWPFLIVVFLIVVFIIKWKTIWSWKFNFKQIKVKTGDNELELQKGDSIDNTEKNETKEQMSEPPEKSMPSEEKEEESIDKKYYKILSEKDYNGAKEIFKQVLENEPNKHSRTSKKISNYYWRHIHGDNNAFDEFEKYIQDADLEPEHKALVKLHHSYFYRDAENYEKALELIQEAIDIEPKESQIAFYLTKKSEFYFKNDQKQNSINCLLQGLKSLKERKSLFKIYSSIANYYEKEKNKFLESIAYQKALECQPNDTSMLFNAAYNFSNISDKYSDLSIVLYKKLIQVDSEYAVALNNLGVAYKAQNLPFKSVSSYKRAVKLDYTLASSNLAYLLINLGFEKEALEYLENAQNQNDIHNNVFTASSKLKNDLKNETEKEKEVISKAERKLRFLKKYGKSIFDIEPINLKSNRSWKTNGIPVKVEPDDTGINLSWEIGEEEHSVFGTRENNGFSLTYSKPKKKTYTYGDEKKYAFESIEGFGYLENNETIVCLFFNDKDFIELKIN